MSLAIFDLDNTLIAGDSDYLWGEFLIESGLIDGKAYKRANDQFYQDYCSGNLDIHAYLEFALAPLARFSLGELEALHQRFMATQIAPIMLPKASALIAQHQQKNHLLLVITATNRFVTQPIVRALGIPNLLASNAEVVDGRYTGKPTGTPCFKEGKVTRLKSWLAEHKMSLAESYFYSDSANDIPLLSEVSYPFAVDPDPQLKQHAQEKMWPIISLR